MLSRCAPCVTAADWTGFYLVSGASWLQPEVVSSSEEVAQAAVRDDRFALSQPLARAEADREVEMVVDIAFSDWESGGTLVFGFNRGGLG